MLIVKPGHNGLWDDDLKARTDFYAGRRHQAR
jgi:hypothetical protein